MKFKRFMAIFMVSAMTVSAGSSLVSAATYQETEKEKFTNWVQNYTAVYQEQLDTLGDKIAAGADLYLQLTDTSRALLGMMVPVDISWLDHVGFAYDVTLVDGIEAVVGSLYVNDYDVCAVEVYIDTNSMLCYMRIPELHDSYISVDMNAAMESEGELPASFSTMTDPMALYPDAAVLESLLTRYASIVFDGFGDSIDSENTLSVEGVEAACTTYEGQMQIEDAQNFMTNLLTTAKDDAELKDIIETWAPAMAVESESGDIYQDFQTSIDELLTELTESPAENDGSYVSSKIWVDADNTIVGREIGFYDNAGAESDMYFKYQAPSNGTETALMIEFAADGESFGLSGQGTITDGKVSGTYDVLYNNVVMASIDVVDYVPADTANGGLNGSYILTLQPGIGEEEYATLSSFGVQIDCATDMETLDQALALTLTMSGAPLGTIGLTAGQTEAIEVPDLASLTNVLDAMVEDDMITYVEEMDWAPILENCVAAGMPEDVASMLDELIYNALYGEEVTDEAPVA